MPETTPLIKAALNLRVGAGFDVYEKLDAWLVKLEKFNIPELQTYVNSIRQDIVAVKNGIAMQYNNGLAEGSVNKLKVIKRIMYGRNSFELIESKDTAS